MLALEPGTVLMLAPDILLRSLPAQSVYYAFNIETGDQYRLNRTSFWILERIGDGIEWSALRDDFLEHFDVPPDEGESDLAGIMQGFYGEKIIRSVGDGEAEDRV